MDQTKCKIGSRLPRIIKSPSKISRAPLRISRNLKVYRKKEDTVDLAEASTIKQRDLKLGADESATTRPSSIPRPKVYSRDAAEAKSPETIMRPKDSYSGERKNVQRVQLFTSPEFHEGDRTQTRSVVSSRPIPTLGQIYGRVDMMDSDRLNDWLMSLNIPDILPENDTIDTESNQEREKDFVEDTNDTIVNTGAMHSNMLDSNDFLPDVEQSTRDNESGYRSLSPISNALIHVQPKIINGSESFSYCTDTYYLEGSLDTIVGKAGPSMEENAGKTGGFVYPKTSSSVMATDFKIQDISSQDTLGSIDHSKLDQYANRNIDKCCESSDIIKSIGSQITTPLNDFWLRENLNDSTMVNTSVTKDRQSYCTYIHKRRYKYYDDTRVRLRRSSGNKKFPSYRYHMTFPFASLRKRFSVHICKRRWHDVWKKTAERWTTMSRSESKSKNSHLIHYLQRSTIWENVEVQTSFNITHNDTGTDSAHQEQKSISIATEKNMDSPDESCTRNKLDTILQDVNSVEKGKSSTMKIDMNNDKKQINGLNNGTEKATASVQIQETNFNRSSNIITICELEIANKETETDPKSKTICDTYSVGTFTSNMNIKLYIPCNSNGIQVSPMTSFKAVTRSTETSKEFIDDRLPTFVTSLAFSRGKIPKRGVSVQTTTNNLHCTIPQLISISSTQIMIPSANMLKKNFVHTEVSALPINLISGHYMTSSSINQCNCHCKPEVSVGTYCDNGNLTFDNMLTTSNDGRSVTKKSESSLICMDKDLCEGKQEISTATFTNTRNAAKTDQTVMSAFGTLNTVCLNARKPESYNHCIKNVDEVKSNSLTPIGRSRLINVYTMSGAASEAATQTSIKFKNIETYSCVTPKQWRSTSVSVSSNFPAETITFPTQVASDRSSFKNNRVVSCACAKLGIDFGINTDNIRPFNLECLTQTSTSYLQKVNPTSEFTPGNCTLACQRHLSEINQRLLSLSRLITQRKSSSQIYSNCHPITENALSSNLNAANWLKRCASIDKGYVMTLPLSKLENLRKSSLSPSFYAKLPEELKRQLETFSSEVQPNQPEHFNYVVETAPAVALSGDRVSDIMPSENLREERNEKSFRVVEATPAVSGNSLSNIMPSEKLREEQSEETFPDENMNKTITETVVQAIPENRDAATEWIQDFERKSVYAVTSRIVLPSPNSCLKCDDEKSGIECLYVYDKPRCIIHKQQTDASVQIHLSQVDIAYKAVFEAAKLVLTNTARGQLMKAIGTNSCGVITDFPPEPRWNKVIEDATQTNSNYRLEFKETHYEEQDIIGTHMEDSCRYYSNLLSKKLGLFRENLSRHIPTQDYICKVPALTLVEACTMKPSGRGEFGCQTHKSSKSKSQRYNSNCFLSPASSLTDICRHDKKHLKSVYYMLSSIEGRLRRLKNNIPINIENLA